MKKIWIILSLVVVLISGFFIIKNVRYYQGSDLERQVAAMRKRELEKKQNPAETQKKKKVDVGTELKKFYGSIELTAEQKTYAEETMRFMQPELLRYRKELAQLTRTTRQTMITTLGLPESQYNRLTPEKIYQMLREQNSLNENQKTDLNSIFQDYRTKRKEINQALNSAKQSGTQALCNLLTEEQKKIYQQEHPPKK
jgi:uncharacterized protein YxeA